jgi:protein O-mannosyl-transferase
MQSDKAFLRSSWCRPWLLSLLLVIATLIAYQPAWRGQPIWDDSGHLTKPELRSLGGLARIWTQLGATQQYYPLVHSVFWVEQRLWGNSTLGYHLVNILLHAFSALLLLRILQELEVPGAWLAAAIFALHPVQVESVAWISELKNTLSGALYLGAALAYLRFDRTRRRQLYAAALGLFALGLLSKTVIATLPGALLVVIWWKRGRLSGRQDALVVAPFFLMGMMSGLFTAWVERKFIGAQGRAFDFTILERFLIAGRAGWFYLGKLCWPAKLAFIYPRWSVRQAAWWQYLFPAAALLLLAALWAQRSRWRGPLAGLLFFVGTLFPALGFFNVFSFRYTFVADHFQYLASLGVITTASAGAALLLGRWKLWRRPAGIALCLVLLAVLSCLTWRQSRMYADVETLWRTTLNRNPDCALALCNLGSVLLEKGQADEAMDHLQKAVEIQPDFALAQNNLGSALLQEGRVNEAIPRFHAALSIPDEDGLVYAMAHNNLGWALFQTGQVDVAITHFLKALEILPDYAMAHVNFGAALLQKGQLDEAIAHFERALEIDPDDKRAGAMAHNNLGWIFLQRGQVDEAVAHFQKAVESLPNDARSHSNLGWSLLQKGQVDEAIAHLQKALELQPDFAEAHNSLGIALIQKGQTDEAMLHFQKALAVQPDYAQAHGNLGWILLRTGRLDEAIAHLQKALEIQPDNATIRSNLASALLKKGQSQ